MSSENNIDKLFKENLKNLEVKAPQHIWGSIEAKITKKKKKKKAFWWFASSAAALIIVGLFIIPLEQSKNDFNDTKTIKSEPIITKTPTDKIEKKGNSFVDEVLVERKSEKKNEHSKEKRKLIKNNSIILVADNNINTLSETKKTVVKTEKKESKTIGLTTKEDNIIQESKPLEKLEKIKAIPTESKLNPKEDFTAAVSKKSLKENKNIGYKNWFISPTIAVINSNSFTDSSPINSSLSGTTIGRNSYSLGVNIGYQINKKWSILTGVHHQEIQFQNNQVAVEKATTNTNVSSVSFLDSYNFIDQVAVNVATDPNVNLINILTQDASINQLISYYEIPIQIRYNLTISERFSTSLITGFSTLFLNNNQVSLTSLNINQKGKANNLNKLNFSGNLGVDVNYQIDKKWSLFINPMFKTQLNTFNKKSNGFSPFFIGLYSGIQYHF